MKDIYEPAVLQEINDRIDRLKPSTRHQWGSMDVAQMLAHCSAPIEIALGDRQVKTPLFAKLMGPLIKGVITSEKPFKQSLPTDKNFIVSDSRDFDAEKIKLKGLVRRLSEGGAALMKGRRHNFFGKLTPEEWSTSTYKHLDHHFRQFGV